MIDLGVLLRVPCVEVEMGFDVSPDGERVAFSWNPEGRWEIYETSIHNKTDLRLISHGPGAKFHPRYSPDGKQLGFTVDYDGSEAFHLFVHDLNTGEERDLTPHNNCSLQADFSWAPDGKSLAFISDLSGQFDTYVIPLEGGEARLVLDAGYPAWKVRWSPDGLRLAVTVEAGGIDFGTYIVMAEGSSEACRIADENGPIDAGQTCWSPDGSRLAFTSDVHGYQQYRNLRNIHPENNLADGRGRRKAISGMVAGWFTTGICVQSEYDFLAGRSKTWRIPAVEPN